MWKVCEVDEKLIMLARQMQVPILTNDYIQPCGGAAGRSGVEYQRSGQRGQSILLPGEALQVNVIQEGKEQGQGVGYLDDGTMVVVEEGRNYIGKEVEVSVTKVLQTAAGRMIFSKPERTINSGKK